ncbi:hypothetical protein BP5796_00434 [Coleophoma crateriformis]|uniref:Uncharacterized protein n=1 Tax=Coleophoma crateriformis TaxID=565419 RepID=A0A3D8T8B6_9HELO|nr:hypothetical protein BP5796_00434 [Coleophoma crateriformis]
MVSAPDIITYIGVPLAVLGVLPIIYNTILTLTTLRKVRRVLRQNHVTAITRGDVINHVIEVEQPRHTIAPLDRHASKEYWMLSECSSNILGGSWTTFNWKTHTTGFKTQRIDYTEQLRQPQAHIGFEELICYLLDLGAIPDAAGFRILRLNGLWVAAGTPLLLSPDQDEIVLKIAPLDDSDGFLSLSVAWNSKWQMRDVHALPPYWMTIKGPSLPPKASSLILSDQAQTDGLDKGFADESKVKSGSTTPNSYLPGHPATKVRCHVGFEGLKSAIPVDSDYQRLEALDTTHLEIQSGNNPLGIWFASVATALVSSHQAVLWNFQIPDNILAFARKNTIPCGALVLLEIITESSTPDIFTYYDDREQEREAQFAKMRDDDRAHRREQLLPPDQRTQAIRDRQLKSHDDWVQSIKDKNRRDAQRAETRLLEALQSPKWENKLIADHCLAWLQQGGNADVEHDVARATEVLLWRMIFDQSLASQIGQQLEAWKAWVENGGMRKANYLALKEDPVNFAYACLLVATIQEFVVAAHGSLAVDLQECLRIWKRVKLG